MSLDIKSIIYALFFGIIPAIIWLWFWLKEDMKKPEPRGRIILTFVGGMFAVPVAIFFERLLSPGDIKASAVPVGIIIGWAVIEEFLKYGVSWLTALRSRDDNEPIDPIIYLLTAALGFAALENALFALSPIREGLFLQSIVAGNMRFIGATLLHVVASGVVGLALAFSFYQNNCVRKDYLWGGLILAVALHALFNFFIIKSANNLGVLLVFAVIWTLSMAMILIFERVKRIRK